MNGGRVVLSNYFGEGTVTLLSPSQLTPIAAKVKSYCSLLVRELNRERNSNTQNVSYVNPFPLPFRTVLTVRLSEN